MSLRERMRDHYTKPGPGVSSDAPRKKGLERLFEILFRHIGTLMLAGLAATFGFLPLLIGVLCALSISNAPMLLASGLVGGAIAAPLLCALFDAILRILRDEPFFWWHTCKKAMRQNWKASLLPGALLGLETSVLLFLVFTSALEINAVLISGIVVLLLSLMVFPLWFAQIALMDLPLGALMKNSLLMAFAFAPRTLPTALMQAVYWGVIVYLLPWSMLWLPLFGLWPICLITLHTLYKPLEETFQLEARFKAKRDAELAASDT